MRVLVISAAFPPVRAGEADHALHLCRNLAHAGLDVHVLTSASNTSSEDLCSVHPIMTNWSWRDLPRLGRFLKECSPDSIMLIYSHWIYMDHPMITFAPTVSKRFLKHVPFVTQFEVEHGARMENASLGPRLIRKSIKQWSGPAEVDWEYGTLLRDSDTVIVLSDDFRKKFSQLLPSVNEKTVLVPPPPIMKLSPDNNGETRGLGRASLGVGSNEFLLAYFGYIYEEKGVDVLLQALAKVSKERNNVRLVIIGGTQDDSQHDDSYSDKLYLLADSLGISEKVIWTGEYPADSDFASVCLRSADACVLPFDRGVTLNRSSFAAAVAHGLPTITTRGDSLESQFDDRRQVLLCPPKNPDALASLINELISDSQLQRELSAGALELADKWFSWNRALNVTIAALKGERITV
jgi:glycosyltransferase involved in cell wall biosynthesis